MEIHLHLGAHRCANQTFHRFFDVNSRSLDELGISVWPPRRTRDGLMRGLTRSPEKITLEDERQGVRSLGRIRLEFERMERDGQGALVISDADLLGDLAENLDRTTLYPLLDERLMRLAPAFADRPLRVGLCIRSYEDYWTSAFALRVAQGKAAPTPDTLDFLTTQTRHWRHIISDIAASLPHAEISVWPFERMANQPDNVFHALTGMTLPQVKMPQDQPRRSGDLRQLNAIMTTNGKPPLAIENAETGRRWMPFEAEHQRVLRAEYRRDIAWLSEGAQGRANYIDGRQTPAFHPDDRGQRHHTVGFSPAVEIRGQTDGIEKKLG